MSSGAPISTISELISRIREGMAPRAVRLFAAQGLLPVSREELIRVLILLAVDGDEEIANAAKTTLATFESDQFLVVLSAQDIDPVEIDLMVKSRQDEKIWEVVIRHSKTADETLRWLARVGPSNTQSAIITNQTRIFSCLEILEDLRANPNANQDVLRRVREFEEEFIEKAAAWAMAATAANELTLTAGPSIEEALQALMSLGMQIPGPTITTAKLAAELDPNAPPESKDAFVRLAMLNTQQRVVRALLGTKEERFILIRDRSNMIVRAVMASPMLSEGDVEHIAGMRNANEEAFRILGTRQKWLRRYGVLRALVFNPKVSPGLALQLLRRLTMRDIGLLARDRNVSDAVRKVARQEMERRH